VFLLQKLHQFCKRILRKNLSFGGRGEKEGRDFKKKILGPMGLPSNSQKVPQNYLE
jgi:hypothetical protein